MTGTRSSDSIALLSPFVTEIRDASLSGVTLRELTRTILNRGKAFRFTAHGYSMAPFICDGDVILVSPLDTPPSLGEVVVFVNPESQRLTVHRVINLAVSGFVIKGDNLTKQDGVIAGDCLLGRVSRVERAGQTVPGVLGRAGMIIAVLSRYNLLLANRKAYNTLRHVVAALLRHLQSLTAYPAVVRPWAPLIDIGEASQAELINVQRHLMPGVWQRPPPPDPSVTRYVAKTGSALAGFVELVRHSPEHFPYLGHWLYGLHVWPRYRRLGIGERLTRTVMMQAHEEGASELLLLVQDTNKAAIDLYTKLGFARCARPTLDRQLAEDCMGRVLMSIHLSPGHHEAA